MDSRKRYQIFVSSTFTDLEVERGKVMETILSFDCFPAGMELFPAMDEEQFKYIKRIIDDSDYYLLIIGGRYGSVDKDGVSWTEKEFDYAVEKGIPVLVFDHKDFTKLPADKTDQDDKKRKKLIAFKKKVAKGRLIGYWNNADDLALAVATSLKKVLDLQPRIGWVRADSVICNAQHEIEKQKVKIRELKKELNKLKKKLLPQTKLFEVENVSFKMIHVEGGSFIMGAKENEEGSFSNEKPAHKVTLPDYWIGETQVTKALWQAVMGNNSNWSEDDLNCPVENVSWDECDSFIFQLSSLTGIAFRLPTEAQWEFAARGGNLGKDNDYRFAGNNDIYKVAWFSDNSKGKPHPVGEKTPNELGLYDMSGNVWELCDNVDDNNGYSHSPTIDSSCQVAGSRYVCRGGSWNSSTRYCRVSCRSCDNPTDKDAEMGLRLVCLQRADFERLRGIIR